MENNMNTNVSTEENTNINDILENNCLNPNETENENNESKEQLRKEKRRLYIANKRNLDKQVLNGEITSIERQKILDEENV